MSRVGLKPIPIASGVDVNIGDGVVKVKGPKGQLEQRLPAATRVELADGRAVVHRESDSKAARSAHGLMRSLLANMIHGVTEGFSKSLDIVGVGYRCESKGKELTLNVGYSHPVVMPIPEGLQVSTEGPTRLTVSGIDKQRVGQFASEIRRVRPPEPYKGKGIRYVDEYVRRKVGKSAAGG